MIPLLSLLAKVSLLLAGGFVLARVLERRSAAARHLVWMLTLSGTILLTVTTPVAPALRVPILPVAAVTGPSAQRHESFAAEVRVEPRAGDRSSAPSSTTATGSGAASVASALGLGGLLLALWALGALGVAAWCLLGHVGLQRLLRRATPLASGEWEGLSRRVAHESGLTAPVRLFRSGAVGSPVTWGVRPVVLLPDDAESWPLERRRVVLAHELAHAARGDYLAQLLASLACAIYWFHPLAWAAARRLRLESERACDDRVLSRGVPGVEYAALLLDVASRSGALRPGGMVAIGMARPSHLEGRLLAVLAEERTRGVPRTRTRIAAWLGLGLILVPLAALQPARARAPEPSPSPDPVGPSADAARPIGATLARDSAFEHTVDASPAGILLLDLESGGGVDIRAWDEAKVRVYGRLSGTSWRDTEVTLRSTSEDVRLHTWQRTRGENSSTSHRFEILVPRRYDVRIRSAGGDLTITGLEGTFRGETGGGSLTLKQVAGRAELSTGGGDILVSDSELDGTVSTGGGTVQLTRVRGGLRGSSGSGPVITGSTSGTRYLREAEVKEDRARFEVRRTEELRQLERRQMELRRALEDTITRSRTREERERAKELKQVETELVAMRKSLERTAREQERTDERIKADMKRDRDAGGSLRIEKAGGDVDLPEAPEGVEISTGGGDVRIGRAGGAVRAGTGGGSVTIGPAAGSVTATTGAGNVEVSLSGDGARERTVEISTGSGSAQILLPPGFSGSFDLETAYTRNYGRRTRIQSDVPLEQDETTEWDDRYGSPRKYVRARGRVGSGSAHIKVRIVNGDITIRRAR